MQNPKKKKPKLRYILFGILGVFLILVCYLFFHDPGIPVNTWKPDDRFSVQDSQRTVIDPAVLLSLDIAPYKNPETVQVRDGWVYAAVEGGNIIRIREHQVFPPGIVQSQIPGGSCPPVFLGQHTDTAVPGRPGFHQFPGFIRGPVHHAKNLRIGPDLGT